MMARRRNNAPVMPIMPEQDDNMDPDNDRDHDSDGDGDMEPIENVLRDNDSHRDSDTGSVSDNNDNTDHELLYEGSQITSKESTLLLFTFCQRFKASQAMQSALIDLVTKYIPRGVQLPRSRYLLEKHLEPDFTTVQKVPYCDNCEGTVALVDNKCPNCDSDINGKQLLRSGRFFLQFNVRQCLKDLFEIDEIGDKLRAALRKRQEARNHLNDVVDGAGYKTLTLGPDDLTCSINTDGVSTFASSSAAIWPLFLSINELSYADRRKHTTLVAMWSGSGKPTFATFLTNFVSQCNAITEEGITWKHRGNEITSKVYFTCVAADSGARCFLQGIKQFNGFYSCHFCLIPGETCQLESGGHKTVFPPSSGEHDKRTDRLFKDHLLEFHEMNLEGRVSHVYGVNAFPPLVDLKDFNIVEGLTVDYMHTALLGVLRTFFNMFLDSKNYNQDYYLGSDKQKTIIDRLKRVKVPYELNRATRDLSDIAYWKAHEWKTWLMVCVPVLKGVLPEQYLTHLTKFVMGLTLLLGDKVTDDNVKRAEKHLKEYTQEAEVLYGKHVCTFNMHLLTHFADCVRNWGPLWCYSLFQFEHANGELTKLINGTSQVAMQIARKICIRQAVRSTSARYMVNQEALELQQILADRVTLYKSYFKCSHGVTMVGPRKLYKLTQDECRIITNNNISVDNLDKVWSYKHFFVGKRKFCTTKGDSKKYCNSVACINGFFHTITQALLFLYENGDALPVVFSNKLTLRELPDLPDTQSVYRVYGQQQRMTATESRYIYNIKCLTIHDENDQLTHVCKLLNSTELE